MIALWLTYRGGHNKHPETDKLNLFQQQLIYDYQTLVWLFCISQKPLCLFIDA
jgi:hypothetical protein